LAAALIRRLPTLPIETPNLDFYRAFEKRIDRSTKAPHDVDGASM